MSEQKLKNMDVNNSDPVFVAGVLYGMMFCIEVFKEDKLPTNEKKNVIVDLINEQISAGVDKLGSMYELIKQHKRVPDLMKVIEGKKEADKQMKLKEQIRKAIDGILNCLKGGIDEN